MQSKDGHNGVEHVEHWKTRQARLLDEFIEQYRPKEINRYEENGKIVRVFEKRWC